MGIINHEQDTVTCRIEVTIDGVKNNEVGQIVLEHEWKWEGRVSFTPYSVGYSKGVDFWLVKNEEIKTDFEPLRFWLDVAP